MLLSPNKITEVEYGLNKNLGIHIEKTKRIGGDKFFLHPLAQKQKYYFFGLRKAYNFTMSEFYEI